MDCKIIEKDAFYIIGATGRIPLLHSGSNPHTAEVWKNMKVTISANLISSRKFGYRLNYLKIFSIALPLANSSTSLSIQRIFCINGSSISSTLTPQITPFINDALGLICGASL